MFSPWLFNSLGAADNPPSLSTGHTHTTINLQVFLCKIKIETLKSNAEIQDG